MKYLFMLLLPLLAFSEFGHIPVDVELDVLELEPSIVEPTTLSVSELTPQQLEHLADLLNRMAHVYKSLSSDAHPISPLGLMKQRILRFVSENESATDEEVTQLVQEYARLVEIQRIRMEKFSR